VFFDVDNTFSVVKENSKLIQLVNGTDKVIVTSGKKTYTGVIIGRAGGFSCFFCNLLAHYLLLLLSHVLIFIKIMEMFLTGDYPPKNL
jgi:hypothetical protein